MQCAQVRSAHVNCNNKENEKEKTQQSPDYETSVDLWSDTVAMV